MSRYDDEVFRLLLMTLRGRDAPGTFAHSSGLAADLLPTMAAVAGAEGVLPAFDAMLADGYGTKIAKNIRAVSAVRREANRRRNQAIRDAVLELGREAASADFSFAALKGAAWIVEDAEKAAEWRWMIDIDLLVEEPYFDRIPQFVERLGYLQASNNKRFRANFHHAPYIRPNGPATVEVHRHLGWRHHLLPPRLLFDGAQPIAEGVVLPAPWCRAYHAIIHWQVQDFGMARATMRLKELIEIDRFLRRSDVDWGAVAAQARSAGTVEACEAAIALTVAHLGAPSPAQIPMTEFGRRHVILASVRKSSPWRTWFAREKWRTGTLWRCEKIAYRWAVRGAGPVAVGIAVWVGRLVRLPGLIARAISIAGRGAIMSVSERARRKYFAL
jgi:hypothetical protein